MVYTKEDLEKFRESPWGTSQRQQKEGLEFSEQDYDEINDYCMKKNIIWFASAWDLESLKFLDKYNLKYNKIASAMIVDKKFVEEVANRGQYTFISTGMSTEEDISFAVNMFKGTDFELMHCVYTPEKDINLKTIFS